MTITIWGNSRVHAQRKCFRWNPI